jgi:polysaccharide pyruvyl transferase WcaK-like protein
MKATQLSRHQSLRANCLMKPLTVEIHGTNTGNRGGEMMAIAVAERMRADFRGVRLVVDPGFGTFEARARHGFWTTAEFQGGVRTRLSSVLIGMCTQRIRHGLGVVRPLDVDIVLDASGFAFSDSWGAAPAKRLTLKMAARRRERAKLVLLPQAFGPFNDPQVASWTRKLARRAEIIYARDAQSYDAMAEIPGVDSKLRTAPDFTIGVASASTAGIEIPPKCVAIVPNARMLDKGGFGAAYLAFLERVVERVTSAGLLPVFVLHDAHEDRRVIEQVGSHGRRLQVIEHHDPRVLKGVLGKAHMTIGSRFHALVGALSQGVPTIGLGWSHKYEALFADFGCPELLLKDVHDVEKLDAVLRGLVNSASRESYKASLGKAAGAMKKNNETMWREVEAAIRAACPAKV